MLDKNKVASPLSSVSYKEGTKGYWSNNLRDLALVVAYPDENKNYECEFICGGINDNDLAIICKNEKLDLFACVYFYPKEN